MTLKEVQYAIIKGEDTKARYPRKKGLFSRGLRSVRSRALATLHRRSSHPWRPNTANFFLSRHQRSNAKQLLQTSSASQSSPATSMKQPANHPVASSSSRSALQSRRVPKRRQPLLRAMGNTTPIAATPVASRQFQHYCRSSSKPTSTCELLSPAAVTNSLLAGPVTHFSAIPAVPTIRNPRARIYRFSHIKAH